MAYDEDLADRLRELLAGEDGITEKKSFGGLGFLVRGNMCVGASGQGGLAVRLAPGVSDAALTRPHATPMTMGGLTMDGCVSVASEGVKTTRELRSWVARALAYARTLPPKSHARARR